MSVNEIMRQVKDLNREERDELIQRLLALPIEADDSDHLYDILEFEGIAARLADDEDPQDYVNRLRDEWDN